MTSEPAAINASLLTSSMTSPRTGDDYVMTAIAILVGAVSIACNAFTLVVFTRNRLLRTINNWLVANLALSDLIYVTAACVLAVSASVPGGCHRGLVVYIPVCAYIMGAPDYRSSY